MISKHLQPIAFAIAITSMLNLSTIAAKTPEQESVQDEQKIQNTKLFNELKAAAEANDVPALKQILKNKPEAKRFLTQVMMIAGEKNSLDFVKEAISQGADIHGKNFPENHEVPLIWAIEDDNPVYLQMLLDAGVNPNTQTTEKVPALAFAANKNKLGCLMVLLKSKLIQINAAEGDTANGAKRTALMFAVQEGHKEIAEALLKAGVNQRQIDIYGATALDYAYHLKQKEIINLLETFQSQQSTETTTQKTVTKNAGAVHNENDMAFDCTLTKYINNNNVTRFRKFLDEAKIKDKKSLTLFLMLAGQNNSPSVAREAIKLGADVNGEVQGDLPLVGALMIHNAELVKILVAAGADPNRTSVEGMNILTFAVLENSIDCLNELLKAKNLDLNAKMSSLGGLTALMAAADRGYDEMVKILLKAGADRKIKDRNGRTALDYAEASKDNDTIELLKK